MTSLTKRPGRDVAVVTPWYPSAELPFRGAFVQSMVDATAPVCDRMTVYHLDAWVAGAPAAEHRAITRAHRRLLRRGVDGARATRDGVDHVVAPVPVPRGLDHPEIAVRHAAALTELLAGRHLAAPVVHAHTGLPGGWAALRNAGPGTRVFVTEHASFLDRVLATAQGREMYERVLVESAGFFAVGDVVREPLVAAFPQHAHRIGAIANPVRFGVARTAAVTRLRRWLFVGSLTALKGVDLLLEAFARCRADDPELTLTMVGEGPLRGTLAERARALGVGVAVTLTGPLPPDETRRLMRAHDLLVHPSRSETFGVAVVEAVAAGLPVLVTRCGGPETTLAGVEDAAGQLIDVDDDPQVIVDGYRRLRSRFPAGLDLVRAGRVLAGRYGHAAVAEAHRAHWFPDTLPGTAARPPAPRDPAGPELAGSELAGSEPAGSEPAGSEPAGSDAAPCGVPVRPAVVFLALGATRRRAVTEESAAAAAGGARVRVVVQSARGWPAGFHPDVEVVDLERATGAEPAARLERALLAGVPRVVFAATRRGPFARASRRAERLYKRRLVPGLGRLLARRRRLGRSAGRAVLAGGTADVLVVADPQSMPLAARLVRRYAAGGDVPRVCYRYADAAVSGRRREPSYEAV